MTPIQQWAAALRSGKYPQGREVMREGEEFCVLGVACDISGKGEWVLVPGKEHYLFRVNREFSVYGMRDYATSFTRRSRSFFWLQASRHLRISPIL